MTESNQYMCSVPLLCAVTVAVFMFQFNVMTFVVCPREHVGDLSHLCLLRAKFKGCSFYFKGTLFPIFIRVTAVQWVRVRVHDSAAGVSLSATDVSFS